jgi:hypothetical protein
MYAQLLAILFPVLKQAIVFVQPVEPFSSCMSGFREGEAASKSSVHPEQRFIANRLDSQ